VPYQRTLMALLVGALGLPILLCVLGGVSKLLGAMQDTVGVDVIGRVSLVLYILWAADLIGLIILQTVQSLSGPNRRPDDVE
jgi:hypothetical protein